jgi:quercetin dioxygenase-like cupin family protein
MQLARWDEVPRERLTPTMERQVLWGEQVTMARFHLGQGTHIALHKHESEQFTTVLAGTLKLDVAGREVVVRPGETLLIPAWVEHEAWAMEDTVVLDVFSPPRADWRAGEQAYLQGKK